MGFSTLIGPIELVASLIVCIQEERGGRPKASIVHGWLAKMRGTLIGDEALRSRGMREMREAHAIRKWKREKKAERQRAGKGTSTSGVLSLFSKNKSKKRRSISRSRRGRGVVVGRAGNRQHGTHRPTVQMTQKHHKSMKASKTSRTQVPVPAVRHHHHSTLRRSARGAR